MRIGLISDTHNNLRNVKLALARFRSEGVQTILHAGDITGPKVLEALADKTVPKENFPPLNPPQGEGRSLSLEILALKPKGNGGLNPPHGEGRSLSASFDVWLVWGNMDRHPELASTALALFGPGRLKPMQAITLNGARIALTHGDVGERLQALIHAGDSGNRPYDYVIHGHTHNPKDERAGTTRVINPGALGNAAWRSPTYAILDLATDDLLWFGV